MNKNGNPNAGTKLAQARWDKRRENFLVSVREAFEHREEIEGSYSIQGSLFANVFADTLLTLYLEDINKQQHPRN